MQVLVSFLTLQQFSSLLSNKEQGYWSIYFIDEIHIIIIIIQ